MKKFRGQNVMGFTNWLVSYGAFIIPDGNVYRLEFKLPHFGTGIALYIGRVKPRFKHIGILAALWFPVYVVLWLPFLFAFMVMLVLVCLFSFYSTCLFKRSFISDNLDVVSGYVSLVLSAIGLYTILSFILNF